MDLNSELLSFIARSPSAFHAVENVKDALAAAGYRELYETEDFSVKPGDKVFVRRNGSSLIALRIPEASPSGLMLAAAHSDSPAFKIKENASVASSDGYVRLNVEKYGGMLCAPWLDRPLSAAGRVTLRAEGGLVSRLVDLERPVALIPNLAIHMDRKANDGKAYEAHVDMLPLLSQAGAKSFDALVAGALGVKEEDILSRDLFLYPVAAGTLWGAEEEFISSPRLDNLTSVLACLKGITRAKSKDFSGLRLIALFDNEEVGSGTKQGAGSAVLNQVLERIYSALGRTREDLWADIASGFMLSVDVAHALHPSHAGKCDPSNKPLMGSGVALKQAAAQTYAGDAEAIAIIRSLCETRDIPWQNFVNRSDIRGGSTLGSLASALVPIRTMDIGVPMLAMHSARELMHKDDQASLENLLAAFMEA